MQIISRAFVCASALMNNLGWYVSILPYSHCRSYCSFLRICFKQHLFVLSLKYEELLGTKELKN